MTIQTSTIKPGLLVALNTEIGGNNVSYRRTDRARQIDDAQLTEEWDTIKRVVDFKEHQLASEIRGKARTLISSVCSQSKFGLLCPQERREELDKAVAEAQALVDDFNAKARITNVNLYLVVAEIKEDDEQTVRAINAEVRGFLAAMESGIAKLDVEAVRAAANKARQLGQVLTPGARARVSDAIAVARASAREIVKAGETVAREIDTQAINAIRNARVAFLDLDETAAVEAPSAPGRPVDLSAAPTGAALQPAPSFVQARAVE